MTTVKSVPQSFKQDLRNKKVFVSIALLVKSFLLNVTIAIPSQANSANSLSVLAEMSEAHGCKMVDTAYQAYEYNSPKNPTLMDDSGRIVSSPGYRAASSKSNEGHYHSGSHKENCNDQRSGVQYGEARLHKIGIMGDGNPYNAEGTDFQFEDDRELCDDVDLTCKASGTLWCEDRVGNLLQAGSGTIVDSEVVWDANKGEFKIKKWGKPNNGSIRYIATGHNYYKNSSKKNKGKKLLVRQIFTNTCYFYPSGNEPKKYESDGQEVFLKKDFRRNPNESQRRLKITRKVSDFKPATNKYNQNENLDLEWSWGVLKGNYKGLGVVPTSIINLPDHLLQRLADNGAKIKQYGFNKDWRTVTVTKNNTRLFTKRHGYLNQSLRYVVLDCNDTGVGASGGASTISVTVNGKRLEPVYAVRVGQGYPIGKSTPDPGALCNPSTNANTARLVRGDFYESLKPYKE